MAVRVGERVPHLAGNVDGFIDGELGFAGELVPQRLPLHIGHDVVEEPLDLTRVEQWQNVGVAQIGGDFDLAQEAIGAHGIGQLGVQHLESHGAPVPQVAGEVHRGHAATTQLALQGVAVSQGSLQVGEEVCYATPRRAGTPSS
jgi:hypothetical protein